MALVAPQCLIHCGSTFLQVTRRKTLFGGNLLDVPLPTVFSPFLGLKSTLNVPYTTVPS